MKNIAVLFQIADVWPPYCGAKVKTSVDQSHFANGLLG
jgi:hypothetical protein